MTAKRLNRRCPICSGENGQILHHQKFQLSDSSLLPDCYDVVSCVNCNFVFADTPIQQQTYNQYYAEFSKYEDSNSSVSTGGGTSFWDKKRIEATAEDILQFCNKESSILDIGCANGGLLMELERRGLRNLCGLDPSRACVNHVNKLGISCLLGELFEADKYLNGKKFDFIILSHVLEHIYDVKQACSILLNLLNDKGMLYVEVPDASHYCQHYIVPYYYFDPEHINHFDKISLLNAFGPLGFDPLRIEAKSFYANDTTRYPAVYGILQKSVRPQAFLLVKSEAVKNEVLKYIEMSQRNSFLDEIEELARTQEPIIVFGAGNFTARLLESTSLAQCNIAAFVDNDKKKQGTAIGRTEVLKPERVLGFVGTIVVCSALHYQQIVDQLKNDLRVKNEIVIIR